MSRVELSAIQTKLKAAIQNHQMLVIKMKGDSQNASLKKRLTELQDEIKRLSEEQSYDVLFVDDHPSTVSTQIIHAVGDRRMWRGNIAHTSCSAFDENGDKKNCGKSEGKSGQIKLSSTATTTAAAATTAINCYPYCHIRPNYYSHRSTSDCQLPYTRGSNHSTSRDGGCTFSAHASNVFNTATGQIGNNIIGLGSQVNPTKHGYQGKHPGKVKAKCGKCPSLHPGVRPVGVTIHPGNTGSMSQATSISLIPAGIISSGCNISLNPINSAATINLGNTVSGIIHGSIGVSHLSSTNHINTATSVPNSNMGVVDGCSQNTQPISCSSNGASVVSACMPSSGTALTNLTNMTNLIIGTNISNGQNGTSHPLQNATMVSGNCAGIVPNTSAVLPVAAATPVNTITVNSAAPGIVISQFPQQPLVQPQLLQQQQQQILQMIQQQQQQQQPQQRLASHTPIKVPQYTASIIRPAVTSTSVQFCNIAPAPSMVTPTPSSRVVSTSASIPQPAKPTVSKETTVLKEQQPTVKVEAVKPPQQQQQQQAQRQTQQLKPQEVPVEQPVVERPPPVVISQEDQEKLRFLKVLDLYTKDAIKEVMNRRLERKRRTTANPNYSFGFEFNQRRDKNGSIWTEISPKKPKTRGKGTAASGKGNGWTDSTSFPQQQTKASSKVIKSNDNHDDFCAACGKGGQLLMCETCRLVYHLDCLVPPLTEAPKYIWSCPKCLISGKGFAHLNSETLAKVHSYIARKTAKEEERKKVLRKGREINTEKIFLENRSKELDAKMKEQTDLQSKLSQEEIKIKEGLNKLSDFVRVMRESRSMEHVSSSKTNST